MSGNLTGQALVLRIRKDQARFRVVRELLKSLRRVARLARRSIVNDARSAAVQLTPTPGSSLKGGRRGGG